jgi:TPR repeat protein
VFAALYEAGHLTAGDRAAARAHLRKTCNEGDSIGCYFLGKWYENGWGGGREIRFAPAVSTGRGATTETRRPAADSGACTKPVSA